jgi:hypothetical protein
MPDVLLRHYSSYFRSRSHCVEALAIQSPTRQYSALHVGNRTWSDLAVVAFTVVTVSHSAGPSTNAEPQLLTFLDGVVTPLIITEDTYRVAGMELLTQLGLVETV